MSSQYRISHIFLNWIKCWNILADPWIPKYRCIFENRSENTEVCSDHHHIKEVVWLTCFYTLAGLMTMLRGAIYKPKNPGFFKQFPNPAAYMLQQGSSDHHRNKEVVPKISHVRQCYGFSGETCWQLGTCAPKKHVVTINLISRKLHGYKYRRPSWIRHIAKTNIKDGATSGNDESNDGQQSNCWNTFSHCRATGIIWIVEIL